MHKINLGAFCLILACEQAPVGDSRVQSRANGMSRERLGGSAEAMAGVHDKLVGTTIGLKSISEILLKRVVLLPKGTEMGVNGLRPSSYLILLMEQSGIRMELIGLG